MTADPDPLRLLVSTRGCCEAPRHRDSAIDAGWLRSNHVTSPVSDILFVLCFDSYFPMIGMESVHRVLVPGGPWPGWQLEVDRRSTVETVDEPGQPQLISNAPESENIFSNGRLAQSGNERCCGLWLDPQGNLSHHRDPPPRMSGKIAVWTKRALIQ